ncbi:MAG: hypothetical protein IJV58_02990 [Oscillospiraceae bacterium]|nr:hypothetical protein [Oscillospiraceae bacterium]MBQ9695374.1 hypothetical protein [Oscillospiraceae bacterium]
MQRNSMAYQVLVFLLLGILLPFVMIGAMQKGSEKSDNYVRNGRLTECTVVSVTRLGSASSIQVEYVDTAGKTVRAKATLNRSSYTVTPGDKIRAYVLSSKPGEVFVPAGAGLKALTYGMVAVIALAGWIVPIRYFLKQRRSGDD